MLNGGLGNQLFQLCHIEKLGFKNKDTYSTFFLDMQNIKLSKITKEITVFLGIKENKNNSFIFSYFQYYLFKFMHKFDFKKISIFSTDILKTTSGNEIFCSYYQWINFNDILVSHSKVVNFFNYDLKEDACFMHIRGGDYFLPKNVKVYSKLTISYYQKSIDYMVQNFDIKKIVIFTNDFEYSKSIVKSLSCDELEIVFSQNETAEMDFVDMSMFKYGIISNSTFSFWSIMINNYEKKKVIAPNQWYKKMEYPKFINEEWIKN